MGLSNSTLVAPAAKGDSRSAHRQADRLRRSLFRRPQQRSGRQGLHRHRDRGPDHLGANGLVDVDDIRAGVLRGRDDADVDAALRRRALRFCAARLAPAIRRDDRRRYADQQDGAGSAQGLRPDAGAALRHLDGIVRQRRRLLPLFLFGGARAATASCRSTSTCRAARRPRRRCCTACCCCRRKSAAPERSSAEQA